MPAKELKYRKFLSIFLISIGILSILYFLLISIFSKQTEPYFDLLFILIAIPSILVIITGYFIYKRKNQAIIFLRFLILISLFSAILFEFFGLDLLSFLPFSIPFILILITIFIFIFL